MPQSVFPHNYNTFISNCIPTVGWVYVAFSDFASTLSERYLQLIVVRSWFIEYANCGENTHRPVWSAYVLRITMPYRIMQYIPRNVSVRPHQVSHSVRTFDAVLRTNLHRFFIRCASSSNCFIQSLQLSDAFYKSSYFLNFLLSCMVENKCSSCPWIVSVFESHQYCFCVVKICVDCVHTKHKKVRSARKVFCASQGWTRTNTGLWCATVWLSIFCALANDDTAVVRIKRFAPLNVGHVQTPFL